MIKNYDLEFTYIYFIRKLVSSMLRSVKFYALTQAFSFFWTQSVKVYITHGLKFKSFNAISQLKFLIYKNN